MCCATLVSLATFALTLLASIASVAAAQSGGAVEHSVTVDGISRTYLVFAPKGFDNPLPVVLALHGGGSNARQMERYTRFNDLAAREGFLVVYPEAVEGNWNDGRGIAGVRSQQENNDDVKFVRLIVDRISKVYKIDRSRVFCTGISNGAFMSHRMGTEASDLIAAIAPVVGGMAPAMAKEVSTRSLSLNSDHPGRCRSVGSHSRWHGRVPQGQETGGSSSDRGDNLPLPAAERQPGRSNRDDLGSGREGWHVGGDQEES
jgi:poly(3-hydroxybutyrate) depolymerase